MVMGRLVVPQHPNHGQQTWSVVSGKTKSLEMLICVNSGQLKEEVNFERENREWMK